MAFARQKRLSLQSRYSKIKTPSDAALSEFEAIKDHLESYMQTPVAALHSAQGPSSSDTRVSPGTTRTLLIWRPRRLGKTCRGLTPTPQNRPRMMMSGDRPSWPEAWDVLEKGEQRQLVAASIRILSSI